MSVKQEAENTQARFAMSHGLRSSPPAGDVPLRAAGVIRAMRRGRPLPEAKAVRLAVPLRWKQSTPPFSDGF